MENQQVPDSLAQLLVFLTSGGGIATIILWVNSWAFWLPNSLDTKFVQILKQIKPIFLVLAAVIPGALAQAATTLQIPGILDALQPYYKLLWLAVVTVLGLAVGQTVVFVNHNFKQRLILRAELAQANIEQTRTITQVTREAKGLRG